MFEPEKHAHPRRAADAGESDFFAAQLLGAFDVRAGDEIIGIAAGKRRDDLEIMSGADGR